MIILLPTVLSFANLLFFYIIFRLFLYILLLNYFILELIIILSSFSSLISLISIILFLYLICTYTVAKNLVIKLYFSLILYSPNFLISLLTIMLLLFKFMEFMFNSFASITLNFLSYISVMLVLYCFRWRSYWFILYEIGFMISWVKKWL